MTSALPDDLPPVDPVVSATGKGRLILQVLNMVGLIVAALYFGQELFVPLTLASLLAFVLAPASRILQRIRLPRVAAVVVTVLFAFAVIGVIGLVVVRQGEMLAGSMPTYQSTIVGKLHALTEGGGWIGRLSAELSPASGRRPGRRRGTSPWRAGSPSRCSVRSARPASFWCSPCSSCSPARIFATAWSVWWASATCTGPSWC